MARETFEMLSEMPLMGGTYHTTRRDLMGVRYIPIKNYSRYLVSYKPGARTIDIIRVLHARMDKDSWL